MRMNIKRSKIRFIAIGLSVVVIALFAVLLRREPETVAPGVRLVEQVDRGFRPEDRALFQQKLDALITEKATAAQAGTLDITLLLTLGNAHYQLGNLAEAAAVYREILALQPSDAPALENLGQTLSEMGDYVGAVEAWQRAATASPDERTYVRMVDLIKAYLPEMQPKILAILEHGVSTLGQKYDLMIRLGDWYADQGDYTRAVSHYEVALQLNENFSARETLESYRQKAREQEAQRLQQSAQ